MATTAKHTPRPPRVERGPAPKPPRGTARPKGTGRTTVSHAGAPALNAPLIVGHIQHFSLAQLTPDPHNARTHAPAQIQKIAASMREFGFVNPILIAADHRIIAGHARWQAAQQLGLPQVPVIVLDHLTPAQRRALLLADMISLV